MEFVCLDVETANADMASICQIGMAVYQGIGITEEWSVLINPRDYFSSINVSIHGIDHDKVKNAPTFPKVSKKITEIISNRIVVSHTHFDRVSLKQCFAKHDLAMPSCKWLDSAMVARRTWEQFSQRGYGLHNICQSFGYEFCHHDALEDAKAAAFVLFTAMEQTGLTVDEWLSRVNRPIISALDLEENPDGPLFGEVIVFTGSLSLPRRVAAKLASDAGCKVADGVTKETTILVVGDQDIRKLAGQEKSSKHRKAETLITEGKSIRIIGETDFSILVSVANEDTGVITRSGEVNCPDD